MFYGDNPLRPKLHFWFGPLSMVDCLGNYNVWYDLNPLLLAVLLVARHLPRIAASTTANWGSGRAL